MASGSGAVDEDTQRLIYELTNEEEQKRLYAESQTSTQSKSRKRPHVATSQNTSTHSTGSHGDGGDSDDEQADLAAETPSAKKKNKKKVSDPDKISKQYADVWKDLEIITKVVKGEKVRRAMCKYCKKDYAYDPHKNGTTSLWRHVNSCKQKPRNRDVQQMMVDGAGKLKARKMSQNVFREMVACTIIAHDLPFSYVEYERVRAVWKYLNDDVKFISRNTAVKDVYKFYESESQQLMRELANAPGRISFTSDLWTAINQDGYLCLTAHYVDSNWNLNNKILSFDVLAGSHNGLNIGVHIYSLFEKWGIEKKVFAMTLDNASANDSMQEYLVNHLKLKSALISNGEFFHVRCAAHILNLIVQDGLKVISGTLAKIRESVKYVRASKGRIELFAKCAQHVGLSLNVGLILDVPTRWNSTYNMLDIAIKYRAAFGYLASVELGSYKFEPSEAEWWRLSEICDLLEPFNEITNLISGSNYPTSNLYFMQVWKIRKWLKQQELSRDVVIKEMVVPMMDKFDKYWDEVADIFAMATVFDPTIKLTLLQYCYSEDGTKAECEEKIACVKGKLMELFKVYESNNDLGTTSLSQSSATDFNEKSAKGCFSKYGGGFMKFRQKHVNTSGKSQMESYLDEPPFDLENESMDILKFWKDNSKRFGVVALMACDILSIPITTVASESSFSIGSRVLNKYRSRLLPKNVQALICSRNWLKGFKPYENEIEGFEDFLDAESDIDEEQADGGLDDDTIDE